jgi:hypothetical protein
MKSSRYDKKKKGENAVVAFLVIRSLQPVPNMQFNLRDLAVIKHYLYWRTEITNGIFHRIFIYWEAQKRYTSSCSQNRNIRFYFTAKAKSFRNVTEVSICPAFIFTGHIFNITYQKRKKGTVFVTMHYLYNVCHLRYKKNVQLQNPCVIRRLLCHKT